MYTELSKLGRYAELARLILISLMHDTLTAHSLQQRIAREHSVLLGPGTLYGTLACLEQQGWIEPLETASLQPLYRLTYAGTAVLYREQEYLSAHRARLKGALMNVLIWILRLYPHAWRKRYGDEMQALLEQYPITIFTVFDMLLGALDARLDPHFKSLRSPSLERMHRLHAAYSTIFLTFAAFIICYLTFLLGPGDYIWQELGNHNPLLSGAYMFVTGGLYMSLFAVAAIQLLLAFSLITRKSTKSTKNRNLRTTLQLLPTLCFFVVAGLMIFVHGDQEPPIMGVMEVGLMMACFVVNAYIIAQKRFGKWMSQIVLLPTACVNLGMMSIVAGALVCQMFINMPSFLGGHGGSDWPVELVMGFMLLALISFLSLRAFIRALLTLSYPASVFHETEPPLEQRMSS